MHTATAGLWLWLLAVPPPAATEAPAAPEATVALPAPRLDGRVSVEAALRQRRSLRSFAPLPLSLEEVGQLCWAAQGVTDDKGHRTAPSARATYPLEVLVAAGNVTGLPAGLYRYLPARHALRLVAPGDPRQDLDRRAVGQGWVPGAPVVVVLTGTLGRMTTSEDAAVRERSAHFMWVEAGLAAQGFFLEATALGLGSTYVGGFRPGEARAVLGLPATEEVLAILPVGRRP
jgi:SagB-type dehydrogenase family enzyme